MTMEKPVDIGFELRDPEKGLCYNCDFFHYVHCKCGGCPTTRGPNLPYSKKYCTECGKEIVTGKAPAPEKT